MKKEEYWIMANDKRIKIRTMDIVHLTNCLNMLKKYPEDCKRNKLYESRLYYIPIFEQELLRRENKELLNYEVW